MMLTIQGRDRGRAISAISQPRKSDDGNRRGGQTFERLYACFDEIVPVFSGRRGGE